MPGVRTVITDRLVTTLTCLACGISGQAAAQTVTSYIQQAEFANVATVDQGGASYQATVTIRQLDADSTATVTQSGGSGGEGGGVALVAEILQHDYADAIVTQVGSGGYAATMQANIEQTGTSRPDRNAAVVEQEGAGLIAHISQHADRVTAGAMTATIQQTALADDGNPNFAEILQTGAWDQVATIIQGNSQGMSARIEQYENAHDASIVQMGLGAEATIRQTGSSHQATVTQDGRGAQLALNQLGSNNEATVIQTARVNSADIFQGSTGNDLTLDQSNLGDVVLVNQSGILGNADITQSGSMDEVHVSQADHYQSAYITQTLDNAFASVVQAGLANFAAITQ